MSDLSIERISKSYGKTQVLSEASIEVKAGETVVVCGPSGAGKTVLLRLVAGVVEPDTGDIRIAGRSVLNVGPERRDIGMAFQNFALYPHLSAFENIASPLRARGLEAGEIKRRVTEISTLLRIEHVLGHTPRELTAGRSSAPPLARSWSVARRAAAGRSPAQCRCQAATRCASKLPRLLRNFGSAVLYVTQDYREAMALADRIVRAPGRAHRAAGPASAIYDAPGSDRGARCSATHHQSLSHPAEAEAARPVACDSSVRSGGAARPRKRPSIAIACWASGPRMCASAARVIREAWPSSSRR